MVEYRELADYPGYRVGSDGSVWSCCAPFGRKGRPWYQLKQTEKDTGYCVVGLRPPGERRIRGRVKVLYVHRLVLEAFVGPCPPGMECCHSDGNRANNALDNLRWGTFEDNVADARRHGTIPCGSAVGSAQLTEDDIPLIRSLRARGFSYAKIAALFVVTESTIRAIGNGKTWKHVP